MKLIRQKSNRGRKYLPVFFIMGLFVAGIHCQTGRTQKSPAQSQKISLTGSDKYSGNHSTERLTPGEISQGLAQNTAPGEYLVTVEGNIGANDVLRIFSEFSILSVSALENTPGVFLLKLQSDPGLEKLQRTAQKSGAIKALQPNFIYRSNGLRHGRPQ